MLFSSRSRSEGKPYVQRRRLTKTAATVNGEYDPDLALAIQESLKQAEIDALKAKENQENKVAEMESEAHKENRSKHSSNITTFELSNETKQLKDLVSVHMDLIQQQQDVINQKDKTIKSLKAENNALQCRLQRMERRMALLRQKEEMSGSSHIVQSPPPKPGTMSYTEPIVTVTQEKVTPRRKLETSIQAKKTQEPIRPSPLTLTSDSSRNKRETHRKRKLCTSELSDSDENSLKTNNLYHISYYEPVSEEIEVESRPDIIRGAHSQLNVETPSFRIKTYTNLYVIEGTEDHEDETFARRHQKPEIEEKRRKRWDNQRVREEKMYEKLREKKETCGRYKKPEDPVESFYSQLEDITHIEVLDKIPVSAFGHSVPNIKAENFSLPWNPKHHSNHRLRQK